MKRECGECQACCYAVRVAPLNKPPATRCQYQCSTGCAIHGQPSKPDACSTYKCGWLDGRGEEVDRPDRSGLILEGFRAEKQRPGGFNHTTYLVFDLEGQPVDLHIHRARLENFVQKGVSAWSYPESADGKNCVALACHDKQDEHRTRMMVMHMLAGGVMHMAGVEVRLGDSSER